MSKIQFASGLSGQFLLFVLAIETYSNGLIQRDACWPGWDRPTHNLTTKIEYCYYFGYDDSISYSWYDAYRSCHREGGELLVVENEQEGNWIREITMKLKYWTGSHSEDGNAESWFLNAHLLMYNETGAAWGDGRLLTGLVGSFYNKIRAYSVDWCGTSTIMNCYFWHKSSSELRNTHCSTKISKAGFICKKDLYQNLEMDPKRPCSYEEAKNKVCPPGWNEPAIPLTHTPYCYKFGQVSKTWYGANLHCKSENGELLYIENSRETNWIKEKVSQLYEVRRRIWIGFHEKLYANSWSFRKGADVDMSGLVWDSGEPNNHCGQEDCGDLYYRINFADK